MRRWGNVVIPVTSQIARAWLWFIGKHSWAMAIDNGDQADQCSHSLVLTCVLGRAAEKKLSMISTSENWIYLPVVHRPGIVCLHDRARNSEGRHSSLYNKRSSQRADVTTYIITAQSSPVRFIDTVGLRKTSALHVLVPICTCQTRER